MDDTEALSLLDAHLDHQDLTQEQVDALGVWLKEHPQHADRAFHRIFLHTFLRQRMQLGTIPNSTALAPVHSLEDEDSSDVFVVRPALTAPPAPPEMKRIRPSVWWLMLPLVIGAVGIAGWYSQARFAPATVPATTAVYEGFDYPATSPAPPLGNGNKWPTTGGMKDLAGGTGWAAAWEELSPKVSVLVADTKANAWRDTDMRRFGPLGYADSLGNVLKTSGIQLRSAAGPVSTSSRKLDRAAFPVTMSDAQGLGTDGSVIWLSFLAQSFDGRGLSNFAYVQLGKEAAGFRVGKIASVTSGNWSAVSVLDGVESNAKSSQIPSGQAVFFVVRITFKAGAEQADIWINPNLDKEPAAATASLQLSIPDFHFDTLSISSRYTTDFDEIRMGESFQSVAPIR